MGMQGCFVSLSEADLDAVFEDPSLMMGLLDLQLSEMGGDVIQQVEETIKKLGDVAAADNVPERVGEAIEQIQKSHEAKDKSWQPKTKPNFLDIDKAWHGIHFLLTGSDSEANGPLAFILCGGREIPSEDFGYGPPHAFTAKEVEEIDRALNQIDRQQLFDEADPHELAARDIYPGIWDSETKEECIGYLIEFLQQLQDFVGQAAASRRALIAYIG